MIEKVGVIGAGPMGCGIAHVFALSGFDVKFSDVGKAEIEAGMALVRSDLDRQVKKKRIARSERDKALRRIKPVTGLKQFSQCDLIVEAVTEDEEVKRELFKNLVPVLKPKTIIATNTSTISITRLATATDRPGRFIGMHFMNPVPLMNLVELIPGIATGEETLRTIRDLTLKLNKTPVVAEDFPAFVVSRILMTMINEAIFTLYGGVSSVESIDKAMKLGANHPMGPLELADFIGLDNCLVVLQALCDGLAEDKYRPCPLLVKYVETGWLGRKTSRGFYDYEGGKPSPTR